MVKKKKSTKKKSKKETVWHEKKVDIQNHRDRLRELHGPRTSTLGWMLALLGMALLMALLNNPS